MPYVIVLLLLIAPSFASKVADVQESASQQPVQQQPVQQPTQQQQESKRPTPTKRKRKRNPPPKKSGENTQEPKPNPAPPEQPPAKTQTPQGETASTATTEKAEKKTSADWWIVYLTGALAFVGVCQLIAMGVQTYWMIRTVKVATESTAVARESAAAASATVRTMRDTAERQLRAYVLATSAQRHKDAKVTGASAINIKFKNFGVTPAYDMTNWMGVDIIPWPLPADLGRPPNPDANRSMSILGPGDITELGGPMRNLLSAEQEAQIRRGEYAIVIWGEIRYRDAFNVRRITHFRYFCIGELINDGRFSPHDESNEAD